jgi:hypothetical protein
MDGARWGQRHHVVRLGSITAVITAQAPEALLTFAAAAQRGLVDTIVEV